MPPHPSHTSSLMEVALGIANDIRTAAKNNHNLPQHPHSWEARWPVSNEEDTQEAWGCLRKLERRARGGVRNWPARRASREVPGACDTRTTKPMMPWGWHTRCDRAGGGKWRNLLHPSQRAATRGGLISRYCRFYQQRKVAASQRGSGPDGRRRMSRIWAASGHSTAAARLTCCCRLRGGPPTRGRQLPAGRADRPQPGGPLRPAPPSSRPRPL